MVRLSRYAHVYDLGDDVALYHSLRMKPVYLNKKAYEDLQAWLAGPFCNDYEDAPEYIRNEVNELVKFKILNHSEEDDEKVLKFVRSRIPAPAVNVCYMITSEQCNLACKYCFLGNNDACKRSNFSLENMSVETADKAVDFFIKQIKLSGMDFEENKPVIIFYGGEPLVNYEVLVYIAEKINSLRDVEKCVKNLEMSMVSNGLLLTEERALKLKELGVSIAISVDGFTEEANAMRVDVAGKNVFNKILRTLDMCKSCLLYTSALGTEEGKEMLFWTKEEYKLFAEEMMDKPLSYYAFQLLYWCGIRSGELLALTPADFNFKKKTLRINKSYQRLQGKDVITTPKTKNSIRTVVMPQFLCDEMQDCLKLYYSLKPDDRIFPVTKYYLNHEMERGCKACGVKKIRVHDLRHSHVSLLINMGYTALAIGKRVGHSAEKITYRYAHLFPSVQLDMAEQLDAENMKEEPNEMGGGLANVS